NFAGTEKAKYEVKFFDEDGTTQIGTTQSVYVGSAATKPEDQTKADTVSHTYTFAGWVPMGSGYTIADIGNVTQSMSFKASFAGTEKAKYEVKFFGEDGTTQI